MKNLYKLLKNKENLFQISCVKCFIGLVFISVFLIAASVTKITIFPFVHTDPNGIEQTVYPPHFEKSYSLAVPHAHIFKGAIRSSVNQKVMLSIRVDDYFDSLYVNGEKVNLDFLRQRYKKNVLDYWYAGYNIDVDLNHGLNSIEIYSRDLGGAYGFTIGRNFLIREIIFTILFLILPLSYLAIIGILKIVKSREKIFSYKLSSTLPFIIILIGMCLRLMLFTTYGEQNYQHDYLSHIDYIKFVANSYSLPAPQKSLEYPQQPLYYISAAVIYNVTGFFGAQEDVRFKILGLFSLFTSVMFLWAGYKIAFLIFYKNYLRVIFLGLLSLTPSIIFFAVRINNDAFAPVFSIWAVYYMFKYFNYTQKSRHFYKMTIFSALAVFSKLSAATVPFSIFIFLIYRLFSNPSNKSVQKQEKKRFAWFCILFSVLFSLIFFRAYIPEKKEFLFILSSAFKNQTIESVDSNYFRSFNLLYLLDNAQAHVYGNDNVRFSYPTYQYGTAFFGEYNYSKLQEKHSVSKRLMKIIYLSGLVLLLSFFGYFVFASTMPFIYKAMILMPALNFVLNFFAIYKYPSVCNSDFRYHISIIAIFAAIVTFGFDKLYNKFNWLRPIMVAAIVALFGSEIFWMLIMILSKTPGTLY